MMVFGRKGKSGVIAALGLEQLGCLFLAFFLVLFVFIIGTAVLFDDEDSTATVGDAGKTIKMFVSSYGYNDNSPPSAQIAFPKSSGHSTLHKQANEGSGMYNDPITFATSVKEFKPGTRVYAPFLQKYFIMEDICGACESAWSSGKYRIDLWMGPQSSSDAHALYACEGYITRTSTPVVVNPSSNLTVDTTPLFTNNRCTARIH